MGILPERDIYTVARLNAEVRAVLESGFPLVWVQGEISNLARPASGHMYFSLKDPVAQVRCALFRVRRLGLRFEPENGQQVLARARISLYEARGEFQLIVEHMEPAGEGALRLALERLKQKLAAEGLFDTAHKLTLPRLPRQIGVLTSPVGAAVHDVITVLRRRFPSIPVVIYPIPVQGEDAAAQIIQMLRLAEQRHECDVLVLTRGGGSLEDLMAFNDEQLARALFAARLPVVSAVGHEIDLTITDLVADRRAPTPSAAAELLSPDREELQARLRGLHGRLVARQAHHLRLLDTRVEHLARTLGRLHPKQRVEQHQLRVDDLERRLTQSLMHQLEARAARLARTVSRLEARSPAATLRGAAPTLAVLERRLHQALAMRLEQARSRLHGLALSLQALSPLATLSRGYSITRRAEDGIVLRDAAQVSPGDLIETRLARGRLLSRVQTHKV
jgi:exodeoxyribonuclease VII large subunit